MASPFSAPLSSKPFAGAQKEAAKKVAQAKAKLPFPNAQEKATTRKIAQSNREGVARETQALREQAAKRGPIGEYRPPGVSKMAVAMERRESTQQKGAPKQLSPRARSISKAERKGAYVPGSGSIQATAGPLYAPGLAKGLLNAVENVPKNTVDTVVGTIPGLVGTGKAIVKATQGHPEELKAIGKGFEHLAEHPWATFQKEPVSVGLLAAGTAGGLGRAAGAVARSGALGDTAADLASMDRAPLHIYGTDMGAADQIDAGLHDIAIPRKYSPDVIRKAGQVAADEFKAKVLGRDPNVATGEQANRYLYGGSLLAQHTFKRAQGFFKPGLVDEQAAKGEQIRRFYTGAAAHVMHELKPKTGAEAVPLAVEGILRRPETVQEDLQGELSRLEEAGKALTGKELRLNKSNQSQIQDLLKDKEFLKKPEPAFQAARHYADWSAPLERRLVELGHLEPDQINAKLVPYALSHMGDDVRYNEAPGAHPLTQQVKSADRQVKAASKALERARGSGEKAAIDEAKSRLSDARGSRETLARDLTGLKEAGFIKSSGDMYPRLEKSGKPLTPDEIKAHMNQELGDRGVGFLTHKQDRTYGKALESYAGKRPGIEQRSRTGVSFKNGTYDRSFEGLKLQAYRNANAIAGHENRDEMLRRFGIGRFHDAKDAERAADNFAHTPEGERIEKGLGPLTPQLIGPDRVIAQRNVETRALGPVLRDFGLAEHKAVNEVTDAPKYTLLPEAVSKRIGEHDALNQSSQGKRLLQWYNNKWRSTALFTNPRWSVGNAQELGIRLGLAGVNPAAVLGAGKAAKLGKDIVDHWHSVMSDMSRSEAERYAARAHVAAYSAGTHYGSIAVNTVRRGAEDGPAADFAEALSESAPLSKLSGAWQKWKGFIGSGMSKLEHNSKAAAIGRAALNEQRKFLDDWSGLIRRQDTAVKKFAEGKLAPNQASKLGNDVMEMMGNWTQLTPQVRRAVQTYSPFGLWWLTSMKFVFRTLPRDHPMKTAALAAMEVGTGSSEKEAAMPSYLRGGIGVKLPIVGDVTLAPEYYSPFAVGLDPVATAAEQIQPQFGDILSTATGVDPLTKEKIEAPQGILAGKALEDALMGITPGARQAVQLAQKGGTAVPNSLNPIATKPGTQRSWEETLAKILSPVKYTAGKRKEKNGLPELPQLPSLPELPELPSVGK